TRMNDLLDDLIPRGQFDLVNEFCASIPITTILSLVGVPDCDRDQIRRWVFQILASDDPEFSTSPEEVQTTIVDFMKYAHDLAADRRKSPRADLLSSLMAAEVDARKLTYQEFGMFFILLLAAGSHTTFLSLGNLAHD